MLASLVQQGLWHSDGVSPDEPVFVSDPHYPFKHPQRVFFNPFTAGEVWVASYGTGLRVGMISSAPGGWA